MKLLKPQTGVSESADFSENTWTFSMPNHYEISAGLFTIVPGSLYQEMITLLESCSQKNMSPVLIELVEANKLVNQSNSDHFCLHNFDMSGKCFKCGTINGSIN